MKPNGDAPINPVTNESMEEDYQYPLMTVTSNMLSNRKYNLVETAQSNQSLKSRLFNPNLFERQSNQLLYQEILKKSPEISISRQNSIHQKLNAEHVVLENKRNQLQEQHQNEILKKCSFHPTISEKSKLLGQYSSKSPRYMSPKANATPKQTEISVLLKKNNIDLEKENVFVRLNKPKQIIQINANTTKSTRQSAQSSPEQIQQITNRLYGNAFQPKKYKIPQVHEQINNPPPSNQEKYQIHHFVKEFYKAITKARIWTLENIEEINKKVQFTFDVEQDLCLMSLDELAISLDYLGFVPYSIYDPKDKDCQIYQLFQNLQCPPDFQMILSRNLLSFLLAMQGYNVDFTLVPKYVNNYQIQFPKQYSKNIFLYDNGNLQIKNRDLFQKQYHEMYINYLAYKRSEPLQKEQQIQIKTNSQTQQLAKNYRSRVQSQYLNKEVELNDFNKIYQSKRESVRQLLEEETKLQCPFKPQINSTRASPRYMFSKQSNYSKEPEPKPSFTPELFKGGKLLEIQPQCKKEVIQRMVKGRVSRQLNEIIKSTGTCNIKKRKQIEEQIYETVKLPILYLDIEMEGTFKRITIFKGDKPKDLALKFIHDHQLEMNVFDELQQIIIEQLDSL